MSGDRLYGASRIRLCDRGVREWQAVRRDPGYLLSRGRWEDHSHAGPAAGTRPGRAAGCDHRLQARPGCDEIQRAVLVTSLCGTVYDARMPCTLHLLLVAAD